MHDVIPSGRGIRAAGEVVIGRGRGVRPRLARLRTTAPLGVVLSGVEVVLMGTAGGPLGGDDLALDVTVLPGVDVTVRSVAATIALPGNGAPSQQRFTVAVGAGATLRWLPEPVVAAAGCDHHVSADVSMAEGAALLWRDELVLGRTGEPPGALTSTLRVVRTGVPLLHNAVGTHDPGWAGPAVTAGARVVATVLHVGPSSDTLTPSCGPGCAVARLGPDVVLASSLGQDRRSATAALGTVLPAWVSD